MCYYLTHTVWQKTCTRTHAYTHINICRGRFKPMSPLFTSRCAKQTQKQEQNYMIMMSSHPKNQKLFLINIGAEVDW